ncbi:hypothetical protein WJX73_002201 [Symbiochloris irregularis]|uniref:Uncharacterized protein n=1 Tax=Symbiochloris irregularis TaxID=706552 RepID=A0AAW1NS76_9CHLO
MNAGDTTPVNTLQLYELIDRLQALEVANDKLRATNSELLDRVEKIENTQEAQDNRLYLTPESSWTAFSNGDVLVWDLGKQPRCWPGGTSEYFEDEPEELPLLADEHLQARVCAPKTRVMSPGQLEEDQYEMWEVLVPDTLAEFVEENNSRWREAKYPPQRYYGLVVSDFRDGAHSMHMDMVAH